MVNFLALTFLCVLFGSVADAAIVEHTFHVQNLTITRLCETRVITSINGHLPGPKIEAHEGDTIVVHVINQSPYNISIHWHGMFQRLTPWSDGPDMITQCPIQPGNRYTYRYNVTDQEGTLWWHAHVSYLRATAHGALIIRPRHGVKAYPFTRPDKEETIILGEWWNANVVDVEQEALNSGGAANTSDAYTINGKPGDLYNCSEDQTHKLEVESGKIYLLRIINAALNTEFFFKVAGHNFTVVAIDAGYTDPYETDTIVIAPGQTVDALLRADADPGRYYLAASPYESTLGLPFANITTRGIVEYVSNVSASSYSDSLPVMPVMPVANDSDTTYRFYTNITGLVRSNSPAVPLQVDEDMLVAYGLGLTPCRPSQTKCNATIGSIAASMNNVSFLFPTKTSLLEAFYKNEPDVYTEDFPEKPPTTFDFTNASAITNIFTAKGTKVKKVKYNSTVQVVLQNTAIIGTENHPIHLHGFNFFVLAQGLGNFNESTAVKKYNLVNPQVRNTIAVPAGGWAVIRFVANNPGIWIMHCHFDVHLPLGLAMAFEVENGPTPNDVVPPPPEDYPTC
ncbi:Laccase [Rhynchospora pubera]|uniref:Laccase n=1 Tax=Rhynchospora pubera TaxID=906938 RepID=A0AAV8DJZ5_9POAL|nr:Laccase [Rhynchospora pubera]KAJ4766923.1 Laccase [Rhynchospora pubera]KAJ4819642.1 Laccase [Rhynchospora pubera]